MPLLKYGAWIPDTTDYESSTVFNINNVLPRADGYGPFPSLSAYTQALPAPCRGGFYALKSDGSVVTFAGTKDRLYQLNNTNFSWTNVSIPATCTISIASPGVITYANSFAANDPVILSTTGALPTGLTAGTTYYVSATGLSSASFSVSATPGGALINTSGTQSGTQSVTSIYPALSSNANWQFVQFGTLVFATQANVPLQVFDLSSASSFSNSAGSPPQAAYISVVGRFLVLSGLLSNPYRIQWSGLNATTTWTSGVNSSDFQDFPDGGIVRGVAGGDQSGVIFQDQSIRRMAYVPGSPIVFQIDRLAEGKGLYAPYSIIKAGEKIFFFAGQGFHKIEPGGVPEYIGREKVDRTFLGNLDPSNLQLFIGAADPRSSKVYWAYKSNSGITGLFDKIIGYDYVLDRFFPLSVVGEYLVGISQTGITLEGLDAISASIDAMTLSLDSYATAVQPQIASFNSSNVLGFFSGPSTEATIESAEQGTDGRRLSIRGFRPITDAATVYGSVSYRDTQGIAATPGSEVLINPRTGRCDMRRDTRYSRFKIRIPASTTWSFAAGVEPDLTTNGVI